MCDRVFFFFRSFFKTKIYLYGSETVLNLPESNFGSVSEAVDDMINNYVEENKLRTNNARKFDEEELRDKFWKAFESKEEPKEIYLPVDPSKELPPRPLNDEEIKKLLDEGFDYKKGI